MSVRTRTVFLVSLSVLALAACSGSPSEGGNGGGDTVDTGTDVLADTGSDVGRDSDSGMTKDEFCKFCQERGLKCPDTMPSPNSLTESDCVDPDEPGTLVVKAETTADSPSIFIDESDTGKDAPAEFEKEPGKYRVRLEADGYLMRSDLLEDKEGQQVEVGPGQKSEVKIPMYRDARGTWQEQEDPDKKPVVEMHTDSFGDGTECEDDVYLYNVDDAEVSYCLHPDDTFNTCSKQEPCGGGRWWKGKILTSKKIRFVSCAEHLDPNCTEPDIFKKISDD